QQRIRLALAHHVTPLVASDDRAVAGHVAGEERPRGGAAGRDGAVLLMAVGGAATAKERQHARDQRSRPSDTRHGADAAPVGGDGRVVVGVGIVVVGRGTVVVGLGTVVVGRDVVVVIVVV